MKKYVIISSKGEHIGTRGTYGLRKNKEDKLCYNQYDSYPSGLGEDILRAIKKYTDKQLVKICQ